MQEEEVEEGAQEVQEEGAEAAAVRAPMIPKARIAGATTAAITALLVLAGVAGAATIVVDTTLDGIENGGTCSLREAVTSANDNSTVLGCNGDSAGADTIVLKAGETYKLTNTFAHEDENLYGDLDIKGQTTITSDGGLATIEGETVGDRDRVIHILTTAGSVTLNRLKITKGFLDVGEGGGGIFAEAPLTVIDSEIAENTVASPSALAFGGGIYAKGTSLTVIRSTIADNELIPGSVQAIGAGIASYFAGSLTLTNTTISGNAAVGTMGFVGGVFAGDHATPTPTTLANVTITGNSAAAAVGGLQLFAGTMTGTVVAGNTEGGTTLNPDCHGGPTSSGGGNVIGNVGGFQVCDISGPNDLSGTPLVPIDANLGILNDNGGLTRTHELNPGSLAINRGGSCPATDQRGFFRAPVAPCDSGAFEVGAPSSLPAPPASRPPASPPPQSPAASHTGQRAAALQKCKRKKGMARKKCKKKANKLPL